MADQISKQHRSWDMSYIGSVNTKPEDFLKYKERLQIFISILSQEEVSYADSFNGDILICSQNFNYNILKNLETEESIRQWVEKIKSRIIMHEEDILVEDIIDDYICCG